MILFPEKNPLRRLPYEVYQAPPTPEQFLEGAHQQGILEMPEVYSGPHDLHVPYELPASFQMLVKLLPIPFEDQALRRQLSLTRQGGTFTAVCLKDILPKDVVAGIGFQVLKTDGKLPEESVLKIPQVFLGDFPSQDIHMTQTQIGENRWSWSCSLNESLSESRALYIPCGIRYGEKYPWRTLGRVALTLRAGLSRETQGGVKDLKALNPGTEHLLGPQASARDLQEFLLQGGIGCTIPFDGETFTYSPTQILSQEGDALWLMMKLS